MLAHARKVLEDTAKKLNVWKKFTMIEKERAIGMVPVSIDLQTRNEAVDELALSVQYEVPRDIIPYCCFASYHQIWFDIGNKQLGVQAIQEKMGIGASQTLHIGDQWQITGNDIAARQCACGCWVTMPKETRSILEILIADMQGKTKI